MVLKPVLFVLPGLYVEALGKSGVKWWSQTRNAESYGYHSHWISSMKPNLWYVHYKNLLCSCTLITLLLSFSKNKICK